MTTLTGQRSQARRAHLTLVSSEEHPTHAASSVLALDDHRNGPRDAAALVNAYARILPGDAACDGVFTLGAEPGAPRRRRRTD